MVPTTVLCLISNVHANTIKHTLSSNLCSALFWRLICNRLIYCTVLRWQEKRANGCQLSRYCEAIQPITYLKCQQKCLLELIYEFPRSITSSGCERSCHFSNTTEHSFIGHNGDFGYVFTKCNIETLEKHKQHWNVKLRIIITDAKLIHVIARKYSKEKLKNLS